VLECYSNKLSLLCRCDNISGQIGGQADPLHESRREATMGKISRQVLEKISQVVLLSTENAGTSAKRNWKEKDYG
jgi:hypothetical protein